MLKEIIRMRRKSERAGGRGEAGVIQEPLGKCRKYYLGSGTKAYFFRPNKVGCQALFICPYYHVLNMQNSREIERCDTKEVNVTQKADARKKLLV